jgi:hypothetical protein
VKLSLRGVFLPFYLFALLASGEASAHRFHASLTDISFNERTGNLEIVTSLMAHDIEALLAMTGSPNVDLSQPDGEALTRRYIEERFQLLGKDGQPLPLHWVGMRVNADSLVIYRELVKADMQALGRIRNRILVDMLPNQENTVNFKGATYAFDREKVEASIR